MSSGSTSEKQPLELICQYAQASATGLLEITDNRKKRGFYFRDGSLYFTSSNLKSESIEGLKARLPNTTEGKLLELQGELRVINASSVHNGSWSFSEEKTNDGQGPVDIFNTVWKALQRKGDPSKLKERVLSYGDVFPILTSESKATLQAINLPSEVNAFLCAIDGERSVDELISFSSIDPDDASVALYFALTTGIVRLEGDSQGAEISVTKGDVSEVDKSLIEQTVSRPEASTKKAKGQSSGSSFDIANMIANQIGTEVAAPSSTQVPSSDPETARLQSELARMEAASNHFEVLGINWDDDDSTYRKAYFELARNYHPDAWAGKSEDQVKLVSDIFTFFSAAWQHLGDKESRQAYIDKIVHGKLDENEIAMERIKATLKAEDDFKTAIRHLNGGRIVKANEILKNCVEVVPDDPEFLTYLGYTVFKLHIGKDEDKATDGENMMKDALENTTKSDGSWVLMGKVYDERGFEDIAKKCFVAALKIKPTNPEALREMKRMKQSKDKKKGGFFKGLFGKK